MSELLTFTRYPATTGISLAYLIDPHEERQGIYFLTFSDGTEYVGQAIDVVTRFRVHARHFRDDIIYVDFAPVIRPCLDMLELLTIRWRQEQGAMLRNKLLVRESTNAVEVDHWAARTYPLAFRTGVADLERLTHGPDGRAGIRREALTSFIRLLEHPEADSVIGALASFLQHSMPFPVPKEQSDWVVTALPRSDDGVRRLACLTVENMQLLTFFEGTGRGVRAAINLAPSPRIASHYGAKELNFQTANGIMQRVHLRPETLIQALNEDPDFRAAAREATSSLIGKGPSMIGCFHCRPLANAMYASIFRSTECLRLSALTDTEK
jgi:hypothetical protein